MTAIDDRRYETGYTTGYDVGHRQGQRDAQDRKTTDCANCHSPQDCTRGPGCACCKSGGKRL